MIKYTLMRGTDSRDNVIAFWLLRTDGGTKECAYLGKCPPAGERGKHAARIKQITLAKPDLYVFEDGSMFARHCDYSSASLIATWETA
jgi:hypothetical protein